jgi:hypothetical protein
MKMTVQAPRYYHATEPLPAVVWQEHKYRLVATQEPDELVIFHWEIATTDAMGEARWRPAGEADEWKRLVAHLAASLWLDKDPEATP